VNFKITGNIKKVAAFDVQADVHYDVFMFFPSYSKCFDKEPIGNFPSYRKGLILACYESLLFGRIQRKDAIRNACDIDLKTGFAESHILKLDKYKCFKKQNHPKLSNNL